MKKKSRISFLVAIAACFALAVAAAAGSITPALAESPVFGDNPAIRSRYGIGYDLVIDRIEATVPGSDTVILCDAVLTRGAETIAVLEGDETDVSVRLTEAGEYTLTYICTYASRMYTKSYGFTVEDIPVFGHSIMTSYKLGDDIPVDVTATYHGQSAPALVKVNGQVVDGTYRISAVGTYNIEMSAEFDGTSYEESMEVTVDEPTNFADLFTGNSLLGEIVTEAPAPEVLAAADNPGGDLRGVRVMADGNGTVIRYGNVIDVSTIDETGLISFISLSGEDYTANVDLRVRLTDVYDSTNYIEWHMYSIDYGGSGNCTYAKIVYDGLEHARFAEAGASYGLPNATASYSYGATMTNCSMDVPQDRAHGRSKDGTRLVSFGLDYAERQLFTVPVVNSNIPWLMLDLDDPDHVGGIAKTWGGFTTGEVWLEILLDGSGNSGVWISSIAGQSVGGFAIDAETDTTGPSIVLENASGRLPQGFVGKEYTVPDPVAVVDVIGGKLNPADVTVAVDKDGEPVSVTDGKFTPAEEGVYTVTYTAYDGFSNEGTKTATVSVGAYAEGVVTCDLSESAFVGETVMLPAVTVAGMSTLVESEVGYYYNDTKLDKVAGDYVFLDKAGSLEVRWKFVDYVGNVVENKATLQVTTSREPIITVEGMPTAALRGNKLILPDFTAVDYSKAEGSAERTPRRRITVNGNPVSIEERTYDVTEADGKKLDVVYTAGTARKTFEIKVIKPGYLSSYFVAESDKYVSTEDTANYTGFRFTDEVKISPINPSVVSLFSGFEVVFSQSGTGMVKYTMTDICRPGKNVYITIDLGRRKLSVMGGAEYDLPNGDITIGYRESDRSITGYDLLTKWADGMPFDGFKGGVAQISFEMTGFTGGQQFRIMKLGSRNMVSVVRAGVVQPYNDSSDPSVITDGEVNGDGLLPGDTLRIPAASAWTSLSGRCRLTVSLVGPDGIPVFSGLDASKPHTYVIDEYGLWKVQYTYVMNSGYSRTVTYPTTIRPSEGPRITLLTELPTEVEAGYRLYLPDYSAEGVGEINGYWLVCEPSGLQHLLYPGDEITLTRAGTYRLTLVVSDDFFNTINSYQITAKE